MKHVLLYESFEPEPIRKVFTKEQINWLDRYTRGSWKYNPTTGKVDVKGSFSCEMQGLTDLKGVEFGDVTERFFCSNNKLTTLEGCPDYVGESFGCGYNQLTSLKGGPRIVGEKYLAANNQLISLEGLPERRIGIGYQSVNLRANPVSAGTFSMIISEMWKGDGKSYIEALVDKWDDVPDEDKAILYQLHPSLSDAEIKRYKLLTTYNNLRKLI